MFTQPANWNKISPHKRETRFAAWMSTEDKPMATPEAKEPTFATPNALKILSA